MSRSSFRITNPSLAWREGGFPYSDQFDDVYFSEHDPIGESTHVFIRGNRLPERWQTDSQEQTEFRIAELGFGTGLNFLNTWHHWRNLEDRHPSWRNLNYTAFELFPVSKQDLYTACKLWPEFSHLSELLLDHYVADCQGWHRLHLTNDIRLDLLIGDAREALSTKSVNDQTIDAWFMDGFSPTKNQSLWQSALFKADGTA